MKRDMRSGWTLAVLSLTILVAGCTNADDNPLVSDIGETVIPGNDLSGTGYYLIGNAYEAEFVGCTGAAAVLEGLSYAEGYAVAPICVPSGSFSVTQTGNTLAIEEHEVACSDGAGAMISGVASLTESAFAGSWQSDSTAGQSTIQNFSGSLSTAVLEFEETTLTFGGTFDGACTISPPLRATLTIL